MVAKKYLPVISKQDFDAIASTLRSDLKARYDASKTDGDKPPVNPATQGAFEHAPALDSKTVASWSGDVKKHLGAKLDPGLIRKGGYDSFDDFWAEMKPKLRASCPDATEATDSTNTGDAP